MLDKSVERAINHICDILMSSDAVSCDIECYEPLNYADSVLYSIPSGHRVTVDYNKLATAIYNAGYRKENSPITLEEKK